MSELAGGGREEMGECAPYQYQVPKYVLVNFFPF